MPKNRSTNEQSSLPGSANEPKFVQCRACFEPIHPKASVCRSCSTHQKYPRWIVALAPGLGLILALLSILSLLMTDIVKSIYPERGSVSAFIREHEDGKRFIVAYSNIGKESVTVKSEFDCQVLHPTGFVDDQFAQDPHLAPLKMVRSENRHFEPTILTPNGRTEVIFELLGSSYQGNSFDDDVAFVSVKMNWNSRVKTFAGIDPALKDIVSNLNELSDLRELIKRGVPKFIEYPFSGLVRDPKTGTNAVWRCKLDAHDRHGQIENAFLENAYVGATIQPEGQNLNWKLIFQNHAPREVNPDINPWGSSCRTCPLARHP